MDPNYAEAHTPSLPPGMTEYRIRNELRDLAKEVGRENAERIVKELVKDELERRDG